MYLFFFYSKSSTRKHHKSNENKRKSHRGKSIQSYLIFKIKAKTIEKKEADKQCPIIIGFLSVTLYFVSTLEVYCKWKPINLDHPDKSKTKKTHRNESSKKTSDNEIVKTSSSPKKPRLESQIKVQTPPPPPDDNVSHFFSHQKFFIYLLI